MKKLINNSIKFEWNQKVPGEEGYERVGAMYCFKRCNPNQN